MTPQALARLHATAAPERAWGAAEFAALLASPAVVLTGDEATFLIGRVAGDEAEILMLATRPDRRRSGRACAALSTFEHQARSRGARCVFLEVAEDNAPARALYVRTGYAETGRRRGYYARPGSAPVDALILAKPLAAG